MKTPRWTGSTTERPCNVGSRSIQCTPTRFGPNREEGAFRGMVSAVAHVDWYLRQLGR